MLLGEPASGFKVAEDTSLAALPAIPSGLPSAMLARRPDVAASQRGLLAAQARVGVARGIGPIRVRDIAVAHGTLNAVGGDEGSTLSMCRSRTPVTVSASW